MLDSCPAPGVDPQFDSVRDVIGRVAMKDPETSLTMLTAILRFLREQGITAIPLTWNELALAGRPDGEAAGICFGIDLQRRALVVYLVDGQNSADIMARASAMVPSGNQEMIDMDGPKGKQ